MSGTTSNRKFGFIMAAGFLAISTVIYFRKQSVSPVWVPLAAAFAIAGMVRPALLDPVQRVWLKIGGVLGFINARIILSVIYFLMITPCAFVLRVFQRRPIDPTPDPALDTYWRKRVSEDPGKAMERQF